MYPIGKERDDFRFSYLASLITNLAISTNAKKGTKLTKVGDFSFEWDTGKEIPKGTQSAEEIKAIFAGIGEIEKRKHGKRNIPPKISIERSTVTRNLK